MSSEKTDAERIIEMVDIILFEGKLLNERLPATMIQTRLVPIVQKILDERDAEQRKKAEDQDLALKSALRTPCYHPAQYVSNWVEDDGKRICLECEITRLKSGDAK